MKLSSFLALLVTFSILITPTLAQDAVRPNPQVEAKAAQALLNAEIKLQKMIPLDSQQKPNYDLYSGNFNDIAIALARLGRTESALKATQFMPTHNASQAQSEVLRLSVRRSAILGDVKHAASLIPQIKNNNAKADALLTVARAYLRQFNYPAAQKVLFLVTPLVPKNFDALVYTASVFAKSGNYAISKRLFDRAKEMMFTSDRAHKDKFGTLYPDFEMVGAFNIYALNAGFVDEWQEVRKATPRYSEYLDPVVLPILLQRNEIDLAIDIVEHTTPTNMVVELCFIAYYIAPQYPDRAHHLLNVASSAMPMILNKLERAYGVNRVGPDLSLAFGYDKLDNEEDSQKWLKQLKQDTPENQQALAQLQYYLYPWLLPDYLNTKSTFSPAQLSQINDNIQPYLLKLQNTDDVFYPLQQLINAQIVAGQITQARGNIEFLDKAARKNLTSTTDTFAFSDSITVADLWKQIGDQKSCDSILQANLNGPIVFPYLSKIQRIRSIVSCGFVDEGLQFFYSLPTDGKKPPQSLLPELPYDVAVAHPNQFQYELLKAKEPSSEARNISAFARGLTTALFHTPSEQVFEINSDGGGIGLFDPQ